LRATGAAIAEDGGNRAFYNIGADSIHLPAFDAFLSTDDYLATLAHELCHWTGAKHRLDRPQLNRFGSPAYAEEELVAEIGAAFVCSRLGIAGNHINSHAGYVDSWLQALKADKKAIFRAAAAAQRAADMVLQSA
jgi:antirestriction protein ArdC